eukprot:2627389-Prymnesium_polylepis.1
MRPDAWCAVDGQRGDGRPVGTPRYSALRERGQRALQALPPGAGVRARGRGLAKFVVVIRQEAVAKHRFVLKHKRRAVFAKKSYRPVLCT